ncbi:MAG: DUF1592 domain-containing protein [Myxococcota bacterium]
MTRLFGLSTLALALALVGACGEAASDPEPEPTTDTPSRNDQDAEGAPEAPSEDTAEAPSEDAGGTSGDDAEAEPTEPEADATAPEDDTIVGVDVPEEETGPEPVEGDPGRVTIHRLNRAEYNHTVRDLLGTKQTPADDFPSDDHGYGYDNNADVLAMSPLLFEFYEYAAEKLLDEALFKPIVDPVTEHFEVEVLMADVLDAVGGPAGDWGWNFWSVGAVTTAISIPASGTYRLSVHGYGQQAGPDPTRASFTIDGEVVGTVDITATSVGSETYTIELELEATDEAVLGVGFINDFYIAGGDPCTTGDDCGTGICKADGTCQAADRNLYLDWFEIYGPVELEQTDLVNPLREAIMICDPKPAEELDCARDILEAFGRRAWRRPLTQDDLLRLTGFIDVAAEHGDDWEVGLRLALTAILTSPHFVFRIEIDPDPTSLEPHPLTDYELASRLSYFLWSSMPDDALLDLAQEGKLQEPEVLAEQVDRMLTDPKAQAIVEHFGGQWLYFKAIDDVIPDPWVFDGWSEELRASMRTEAWLHFHSYVTGDKSMLDLLDGDDVFVDERLADHYDLGGFFGPPGSFVQMTAPDGKRGGVMRQGAFLTALSYPTRTSPVKRGKWIMGQLMCQAPPPPPPGVEGLPEADLSEGLVSIREILELHREDPTCNACHSFMDPIGLAFENYDGIGAWRDEVHGLPVDATGELPNGNAFDDAQGLIDILVADNSIPQCMAIQLATYALGRGLESSDMVFIEAVTSAFADDGYRFKALATHLVQSPIFRTRRGEPIDEEEVTP